MTAQFTLPDTLEGVTLEDVKHQMLQMRGSDLELMGSAVSRINGLGFQLLLSAFKTWKSDGFQVRVVDPSPPLLDAFTRLSCQGQLAGAVQ